MSFLAGQAGGGAPRLVPEPSLAEVRQEWRNRSTRAGLLKVMRTSKPLNVTQTTAVEMEHYIGAVLDKACGPLNGKMVLDAGCGIGRFHPLLLTRGAQVTGLDVTEEMLRLVPDEQDVSLVRGELEQLPFKDNTYYLGIVVWVLMHILDDVRLTEAAAELSRCCENLLICEYVSAFDPVGRFSILRSSEVYESLFPAFNAQTEEYFSYGGDTSSILYLERAHESV